VTDNVGLAVEEGAGIVRLTSSVEVINSIAGVLEGDASVSTSLHPMMMSRTTILTMAVSFPGRPAEGLFINGKLSKVNGIGWYK
jgi:hypothetical protein